MDSFKGKTAFVTGSTSGIGRAAEGQKSLDLCETLAAMALSSRSTSCARRM